MSRGVPTAVEFLEEIGFEFGLDWDGELKIAVPPSVPFEDVAQILCERHLAGVKEFIKARADYGKQQLVGGPLNGHKHARCYWTQPVIVADLREWKIMTGERWAVYLVQKDRRAMYVGMATSEGKGRKLGWEAATKSNHPMTTRG